MKQNPDEINSALDQQRGMNQPNHGLSNVPNYILALDRKLDNIDYKLNLILSLLDLEGGT